MGKHLKTQIIDSLGDTIATFVQLPPHATPHTRGVRYFVISCEGIQSIRLAMGTAQERRRRKKCIIVRPSRFRKGLHELYTYHCPTHWSAACRANRELIKEAQRRAHAIERDRSLNSLEWRTRFLHQYYTLPEWNKSMDWVPVEQRRYPHFYTYVFTTIYRALKAEQQKEQEVSFEPIPPSLSYPRVNRGVPLNILVSKSTFCYENLHYRCRQRGDQSPPCLFPQGHQRHPLQQPSTNG